MKLMGQQIRRTRIRRALSLADLAVLAGISKTYLSLIETGRLANPPSDEKLQRLEKVLDFAPGELVGQAHVHRTPSDVRAVLEGLIRRKGKWSAEALGGASVGSSIGQNHSASESVADSPVDLDAAFMAGVLQELADRNSGNIEPLAPSAPSSFPSLPPSETRRSNGSLPSIHPSSVPVINKVSAGYPKDFTDMSYPPRVADGYVYAPDIDDPDAFAARVSGDSMSPKYAEGDIVIFSPAASWKNGADCFVRFEDGQTTFKRVYVERSEAGEEMLRLQPRNERYQPRVSPREEIAGVYRAVSVYRSL